MKKKNILAKGNVILKKDGVTLNANIVKADYLLMNGENILRRIIAKKKVIITKNNIKATGQYMTYDLKEKIEKYQAIPNIHISNWIHRVKKLITFDNLKNKAEAIGDVKIILSNKTFIYADNVKADFEPNNKSLKKAVAKGNVMIENKARGSKSRADLGIYNSKNKTVLLSGNVVIFNKNSKSFRRQRCYKFKNWEK